jgi:hypothetical protein
LVFFSRTLLLNSYSLFFTCWRCYVAITCASSWEIMRGTRRILHLSCVPTYAHHQGSWGSPEKGKSKTFVRTWRGSSNLRFAMRMENSSIKKDCWFWTSTKSYVDRCSSFNINLANNYPIYSKCWISIMRVIYYARYFF